MLFHVLPPRFRRQSFVHKGLLTSVISDLDDGGRLARWLQDGELSLDDLHAVLRCLTDAHMTLNKMAMTGAIHNVTNVFMEALGDMDPGKLYLPPQGETFKFTCGLHVSHRRQHQHLN